MLKNIINKNNNENSFKIIMNCMDDLTECVYHQLNVLNDLIDYNLINYENIENNIIIHPRIEHVDMCKVIHSIIKIFTSSIKNKNINFKYTIDPKIEYFFSDSLRIKRVIINLISNAVKFVKENTGEITVNCKLDNDMCLVEVIDNGEGISDKKNIFNKIIMSQNTSDDMASGSGLGLMICSNIIKSLNGEIDCKDNIPSGTIMYFTIPYIKITPEVIEKNIITNQRTPSEIYDILKTKNILFADDNNINRKIIKRMLDKISDNIIVVSDGTDVVNLFLENPDKFDLLILDIHMNKMNGDKAAEIIQKIKPKIPIIFLTGESITTDLQQRFPNCIVLLKPCKDIDIYRSAAGLLI
jgi:CheY-like chemotaxis protein